jgi:hypothetical protein
MDTFHASKTIKMLIISSCTREKASVPEPPIKLKKTDFDRLIPTIVSSPASSWHASIPGWSDYLKPAIERYTGEQHKHAVKGLNILREKGVSVDLNIISAGYGLIKETDQIADYDLTFSDKKNCDIIGWSKRLRIQENVIKAISNYDIVFFLLGKDYLTALNLPLNLTSITPKMVFFTTKRLMASLRSKMAGTFSCFVDSSVTKDVRGNSLGGVTARKGYMIESFANNVTPGDLVRICARTSIPDAESIITSYI